VSDATALRQSYRHCAEVARRSARNFYYGFLLLPPARRRAMCALYAFMRRTDDLADDPLESGGGLAALEDWRGQLDASLAGGHAGASPILSALADTARRHAIPPRHLHEVIDGVAMDLAPRTFPKFEDLYAYCYRVASAVGLCCIHIWGYRSEGGRAEALAESCGVALQLTNILRDVREDAGRGRLYLPLEDLERFGVPPEDVASGRCTPAVRALLEFQARRAAEYYRAARPLARLVAPVGRPVLGAIVGIYRALLDEIARRGCEVLDRRVALPGWRKAAIALRALAGVPA
jgi:phytoene synthase